MIKYILTVIMCTLAICASANTCYYDNIRVTLHDESVTITSGFPYGDNGYVDVTVNDTKVKEVRILVEVDNGQREDITVRLIDGHGSFNLPDYFSVKLNNTYKVKLLSVPGMCF